MSNTVVFYKWKLLSARTVDLLPSCLKIVKYCKFAYGNILKKERNVDATTI